MYPSGGNSSRNPDPRDAGPSQPSAVAGCGCITGANGYPCASVLPSSRQGLNRYASLSPTGSRPYSRASRGRSALRDGVRIGPRPQPKHRGIGRGRPREGYGYALYAGAPCYGCRCTGADGFDPIYAPPKCRGTARCLSNAASSSSSHPSGNPGSRSFANRVRAGSHGPNGRANRNARARDGSASVPPAGTRPGHGRLGGRIASPGAHP
ncbi:MAG: hypothetical protein BWY76_01279 [bacterium ADurb.Bin429]|nr:MAG: hypothetical protein BWY76_01279 [bacterium ADurb.Bin429]